MNLVTHLLLNLALCFVLKTLLKVTAGLVFNAWLEWTEGCPGQRLAGWISRSATLVSLPSGSQL